MSAEYLIIPSENRTREFDAKLLTACCAVEAGYRAIIGSRHDIHLSIDRLPRSTYVGKDLRASSARMVRILNKLGHRIVAWDEEALVYYTRDYYLAARVHAPVLNACQMLFAWGQDNAEIWRSASDYNGKPIREVGNPRVDLLRPELRALHQAEVDTLRGKFGRYILLNSNFGSVNHLLSDANETTRRRLTCDRATAYHQETLGHRRRLFERFIADLPAIARALPDATVVVRPHPSENPLPWLRAAAGLGNVQVCHEGGIVPWLLGADAIIHNGCTTAIEATILGRRSIAYRPVVSEAHDIALPNRMGETAFELDDLLARLTQGGAVPPTGEADAIEAALGGHVSALAGPLSSDRIVAEIRSLGPLAQKQRRPSLLGGWSGQLEASTRRRRKESAAELDNHKNGAAYNEHRFPALSLAEVQLGIERMGGCLGRFQGIAARRLFPNVFELRRAR